MSGYQDISDFDECAIILTQMFVSDWDDLTPGERGLKVMRTRTELSKLRTKWVAEVETLLVHTQRERDTYLETLTYAQEKGSALTMRVQGQEIAIDRARACLERAHGQGDIEDMARAIREAYTVLVAARFP